MADDDELFIITQTGEDNPTNLVDPALQLPHHIPYSIFSYLSFHDLHHVRRVSKNWHHNTPSLECLPNNEFRDSLQSSIDAWKNKLFNAEKRVLHIQKFTGHSFNNIHDIMKLLDGNDFHEVYLRIDHQLFYIPPLHYIFQSKCLTILHLTNCVLDKRVLCDEVTIPSLQELKLECVTLSEQILSKFISKCPNIRELSLVTCWASFIVLTNLACLLKLYLNVTDSFSFTTIQVISPRLRVFHFISRDGNFAREFHLNCSKFPNGLDTENFCSDFPHLETLLLGPCQTEKPITISSSYIVSSSNLPSFQYKRTTVQPYLAPLSDTEMSYNIVLVPKIHEIMHRAWFLTLRSHLENFSNHNTTLELRIHIIDNLLWMSHPNTLTLSIPTSFCPTALEGSKQLYGRGDRNCCSGTHDKCWRHFLKHFEVKEEEKEIEQPVASISRPGNPWKVIEEVSDEKKYYKLTKLIFVFIWQFNI
ncbi:hypothetical protein R3W88_010196 [Solanum pinnatisectum]|uniref:F-box domain-containing protein n=1 Tax=Solanum pinnatisectum TaxID=50273 RepID=A0AAV9MGF1_9SOLN|nr:hypothetical protein R3W88_010196 [Solanum pinnatisectum]